MLIPQSPPDEPVLDLNALGYAIQEAMNITGLSQKEIEIKATRIVVAYLRNKSDRKT